MNRLWPALKFAFWTYFWTLGIFSGFVLALRYSERWRHAGSGWTWWQGWWANLEGFWFLPLPIFLAAALAFWLAPRWGKGLTLLLTPLFLTVWVWSPYGMDAEGIVSLMLLILPAALLASVPETLRSRRGRPQLK
ncbi:hypothetical protein DVJ83_00550 [Deinococcus wulumuqiensis]|uniref:Uncharacterized protein n=1 Tax=Deinococcus wulumuqiensis TaxID=980427 RepID=A0A345IDY6_9DEIO|nr:hypothetical protein [Deinococcus wulumuqiensis]AXG97908.1 hypothetical protein DVJ83_00550 [Deinococcus wulumuqiensis]